jgi:hypothetical protein
MTARRLTHTRVSRAVALGIAVTLWLSSAAVASETGPAPGVARHGVCVGGSSQWRLRVTSDDTGTLVVRFRLTGGNPGETWNLFLDQNGTGFFAGSRVSDDTGVVHLRRRADDLPGIDVIRAAGHDVVTGEVCRGHVHI